MDHQKELDDMCDEYSSILENCMQSCIDYGTVPLEELKPLVESLSEMQTQNMYIDEVMTKISQNVTTLEEIRTMENAFVREMALIVAGRNMYDTAIMRSYNDKLNMKTEEDVNMDESQEVVVTQATQDYIDPFTKKRIQDPVRNTHCSHLYDKNTANQLIQRNDRTRCPVVGCSNRMPLRSKDLVLDRDVALIIQKMR